MNRAFLLLVLPLACFGQNATTRGLEIYNTTCGTGYCHGVAGTAGGAPRLAARGFDDAYVMQVVRQGIPHTGMPSFGTMERADLLAVVAYVDGLNGVTPPANANLGAAPARPKLAPDAQKGRGYFTDQVRGLVRCSVCHQADGLGFPVTLGFKAIPASVAELRQVKTPGVETATAEGDTFPALVLDKNGEQPKLYDLTIPPPVLRTFAKGAVTYKEGSNWHHSDMLKPYTDQELDSILIFLRAVTK